MKTPENYSLTTEPSWMTKIIHSSSVFNFVLFLSSTLASTCRASSRGYDISLYESHEREIFFIQRIIHKEEIIIGKIKNFEGAEGIEPASPVSRHQKTTLYQLSHPGWQKSSIQAQFLISFSFCLLHSPELAEQAHGDMIYLYMNLMNARFSLFKE